MEKELEFQTSDIYLGATLLAEGCKFKAIKSDIRQNRKIFVFEDSTGLRNLVTRFMANDVVVHLRSYLNAWRELRRQVDY